MVILMSITKDIQITGLITNLSINPIILDSHNSHLLKLGTPLTPTCKQDSIALCATWTHNPTSQEELEPSLGFGVYSSFSSQVFSAGYPSSVTAASSSKFVAKYATLKKEQSEPPVTHKIIFDNWYFHLVCCLFSIVEMKRKKFLPK